MVDVAFNITDGMFTGNYHGSRKHRCDLGEVCERAVSAGVRSAIVSGGSFSDIREALELIGKTETELQLALTVGVHPTRCNEFLCPEAQAEVENKKEHENSVLDERVLTPRKFTEKQEEYAAEHLAKLEELILGSGIAANAVTICGYGEFGLDYDRLHFCSVETQREFFARQLPLALF